MIVNGIDPKKFKHRHAKKSVEVGKFSGEEKYYVEFGDFFYEVGLNFETYKKIVKEMIQKCHITHVKNRFEKKESYEYFKKILYTLSIYNFQYNSQIKYLFLYLISDKTIANSIKKYKPTVEENEYLNIYNHHQNLENRPMDFAKKIEIVFEGAGVKESTDIDEAHKLYIIYKNVENYKQIFEDISNRKFKIYQILDSGENKIITLEEAQQLDVVYKKKTFL